MANSITITRYALDNKKPVVERSFFREYDPSFSASKAHTPPGLTGSWVFLASTGPLYDADVDSFVVNAGLPNQRLDVPADHAYWKPLGTAEAPESALPLRVGVVLIAKEDYDAYQAGDVSAVVRARMAAPTNAAAPAASYAQAAARPVVRAAVSKQTPVNAIPAAPAKPASQAKSVDPSFMAAQAVVARRKQLDAQRKAQKSVASNRRPRPSRP